LQYADAMLFATIFIIFTLSRFAMIFFNGFSNVHNYVPIIFSSLLALYLWFYRPKAQPKLGNFWYHALLLVTFGIFASGTELNAPTFFLILGGFVIISLIKKNRDNFKYLKQRASGIVGFILGAIFFWVIGDGYNTIVSRSDGGYKDSLSISSLFTEPLSVIPQFTANIIDNIYTFLPYLLLATLGVFLIRKTHKAQNYRYHLFILIVIFALVYLVGLSPVSKPIARSFAMVFSLLLVPTAYVLSTMFAEFKKGRILQLTLMLVLTGSMLADNTAFLADNLARSKNAIIMVQEQNCIDAETIERADLPTRSQIFRFNHNEPIFEYVTNSYYRSWLNLNGHKIPIKETCK